MKRFAWAAALCSIGLLGACSDDATTVPDSGTTQMDGSTGTDSGGQVDRSIDAPANVDGPGNVDGGGDAAANVDGSGDAAGNVDGNGNMDGPTSADGPVMLTELTRPSRSSSIAISEDDSVVAAVNPDDNSITFVNTSSNSVIGTPVSLGNGAEPWAVVFGLNNTVWVANRLASTVVKISGVNAPNPTVGAPITVGSEPTALALAPSGRTLLVANYGEGTISVIDTTMGTGVATSKITLPPLAGGQPNAVRSIVVTNNKNGMDGDESYLATSFFGERRTLTSGVAEQNDQGLQGVVWRGSLSSLSTAPTKITLGPLGQGQVGFSPVFADATGATQVGAPISCSPNQLYNIAVYQTKAYVTSVCASPQGPQAPFSQVQAGLHVIDLTMNAEATSLSVNLNKLIQDPAAPAPPATGNQAPLGGRYVTQPIELDFVVGGSGRFYVAGTGSDAVFPFTAGTTSVTAGAGTTMNIPTGTVAAGKGLVPIGVTTSHNGNFVYTNNWTTKDVTVINATTNAVVTQVQGPAQPAMGSNAANILTGKRFFFTGAGRWSRNFSSSCGACHPDGLTDNITWAFAAGPRQTIALDGMFNKNDPTDQRVLNWTAIFDEVHDFELNTRTTSFGVGAIVKANTTPVPVAADRINFLALNTITNPSGPEVDTTGASCGGTPAAPTLPCTSPQPNDFLNGSAKRVVDLFSVLKDWNNITTYTTTIRSLKAPTTLTAANVAAGRTLFQTTLRCTWCHGGPKWTISKVFYTPSVATNTALNTQALTSNLQQVRNPQTGNPEPANFDTVQKAVENLVASGNTGTAAPPRITCVLRNVGTFNGLNSVNSMVTTGAAESRQVNGMAAPAEGRNGFNIPSLLSQWSGAPYLHNGQATSLVDLFDSGKFDSHLLAAALPGTALNATVRTQIREFVSSIDGTTMPFPVPVASPTGAPNGGDICP